jgi:hypothetical protein
MSRAYADQLYAAVLDEVKKLNGEERPDIAWTGYALVHVISHLMASDPDVPEIYFDDVGEAVTEGVSALAHALRPTK